MLALLGALLAGCGASEDSAPASPVVPSHEGVQMHTGRAQINPNAQMPAAGSRAR